MRNWLRVHVFILLCFMGAYSYAQDTPSQDASGQNAPLEIFVEKDMEAPNVLIVKPMAASPFSYQDELLKQLNDLLLFDLQFSGAFNVFEETTQAAFINQQEQAQGVIDYNAWKQLRVNDRLIDYVVKTELVPRGPGYLQLNVYVYNVLEGQRPIGQAYGSNPPIETKDIRAAGHQATADIITTLTAGRITPITTSKIMFVNYIASQKIKEIYMMDYDGWEDSIKQITKFKSNTLFPDWSPNGNEIAYVSFKDGWSDCFVHNLITGKVTAAATYKNTNNTPRWYPDGIHLAASLSAEGNPEIYKIHKEKASKPVRLTNNRGIDVSPDVSPDGTRIAFISDRIGSPQVYIMNADGSGQHRISHIQRKCESPMWSPVEVDGTYKIAFTGYYDSLQGDIYTVNPDGTGAVALTDGRGDNKNATWSPNGMYVVYSSNRLGGKHDLYISSSNPNVLLPNGKPYHRITFKSGDNLSPVWSPK